MAESRTEALGAALTLGETRKGLKAVPRRFCGEVVLFMDLLIIAGCALVTAFLYHTLVLNYRGDYSTYLGVGLLGAVFAALAFQNARLYKFENLISLTPQIPALIARWTGVVFALIVLAYLTKTSTDYPRGWLVLWYGSSLFLLTAGRVGARFALRELSREGRIFARHVAVVGATDISERFCALASEREVGLSIIGVFDDRAQQRGEGEANASVAGNLNDLMELAQTGRVDEIVITLPWAAEERIEQIVQRLSILPVSTRLCPDKAGLRFVDSGHSSMGGVLLLDAHRRPLEGWGGVIKVIEDRALSAIALMLLAPIFLLIAAAIKLDSRGPVFFRQRRHGFNHGVFYIYKFRTMTAMEDGPVVSQAKKDDSRITRIGRILRRSSLDELPQLINVLKGDMSLVGPRPHALAHNDQYAQLIEDYAGRHKVKPGITGWAQVNGFRGETDTDAKMESRVRHDLHYIENWSLVFDIKILALTVIAVLFPKNAY